MVGLDWVYLGMAGVGVDKRLIGCMEEVEVEIEVGEDEAVWKTTLRW
jgi:hypothetical protein